MSAITTHILDTSRGRPAQGVPVTLEVQDKNGDWQRIGSGMTDGDGRLKTLSAGFELYAGQYRLLFDTGAYFAHRNVEGFYPSVEIRFVVRSPAEHHHVPLLLNPFGYTTYRGS